MNPLRVGLRPRGGSNKNNAAGVATSKNNRNISLLSKVKKNELAKGKKKRKDFLQKGDKNLQKRERERERRAKIKSNPKKYAKYLEQERLRKKKALADGKLKHVKDMTPREVRNQRKKKREQVRRCREKKKALLQPPSSDTELQGNPSLEDTAGPLVISGTRCERSRQSTIGEKLRKIYSAEKNKKIEKLQREISKLKKTVWKLKKAGERRTSKLKSPQMSPSCSVARLCSRNKNISSPIKRRLLEGYTLKAELRASLKSISSFKAKQIMGRLVSGRILKQYRQLQSVKGLFSLKQMRQGRKLNESNTRPLNYIRKLPDNYQASHNSVHNFFLSNETSTECPGKRQGRKYDGVQRQRRYLKDNLKELHKTFMSKNKKFVSYRTFCRNKPSWVVKPKLTGRDTCLCKTCENVKYLFIACKSNGLVNVNSVRELTTVLCCDTPTTACFLRECSECRSKAITYPCAIDAKPVMYYEWVVCSEQKYNSKTKKDVNLKITKKVSKYCTIGELKQVFESKLNAYLPHVGRCNHQAKASENVIKSLNTTDICFLIDWSMNYVCKYGTEPQSVHFGGSHSQIALYTGRAYLNGGKSESFCSLSENTRHDPKAHLKPILDKYLSNHLKINKLIFLSDGPVTQYRNRDLYYLVTQYLTKLYPKIMEIEWIYSEAGHGKGEADGVGGTTKRTADTAVAHGQDVDCLKKLKDLLDVRCPSVFYCIVKNQDIEEVDKIDIPKSKAIKGTLNIHNWKWLRARPLEINFKTLKCYSCVDVTSCCHYRLSTGDDPWLVPDPKPQTNHPDPKPPKNSPDPNPKKTRSAPNPPNTRSASNPKKTRSAPNPRKTRSASNPKRTRNQT